MGTTTDDKFTNPYLAHLFKRLADHNTIDADYGWNEQLKCEYLYACTEVPFEYNGKERSLLIDLNVYIDKMKLNATIEGKIGALFTSDIEIFMEKVIGLFGAAKEIYTESGWILSGDPDIPPPILVNLSTEYSLLISRIITLENKSFLEFGNTFLEAAKLLGWIIETHLLLTSTPQ